MLSSLGPVKSRVASADTTETGDAVSSVQDQTYQTRNGPRTREQLQAELEAADYDVPWDVASMLAAYQRAGELVASVTYAGQPAQTVAPRLAVTAPTRPPAVHSVAAPLPTPPFSAPSHPIRTASTPATPPGWTPVWSDDFAGIAGSPPSAANWLTRTGTQYPWSSCPNQWGTNEVETNTTSTANVQLDGSGHLLITPINSGGNWTSARIETQSTFGASAGKLLQVSASIAQPNPANGQGYWPAFWMLGDAFRGNCSAWPGVGEIDIMEDINATSRHAGTFHCGTFPGGPCNEGGGLGSGRQACTTCQTDYHTYSVIIDRTNMAAESITWYLDGNQYFSVSESQVGTAVWQTAVDHPFFLILDVAMGGDFPGPPNAATSSGIPMSVANVAVYQSQPVPLTVTFAGTGGGTVSSSPQGISCSIQQPPPCSASFTPGSTVTLTATPIIPHSYFAGWSGACTGIGVCMVTMAGALAVTAIFLPSPFCTPRPPVSVSANPAGPGRLQVTITATLQDNAVLSLQFGDSATNPASPANALIDIGSTVGASGQFTYTAPLGATQVTVFIRRGVPGIATTVPIVVHDLCGHWQTFVGGGPSAF